MISLLITLVSHSIIMKVDLFTFFLQDLIKLCVDKAERLFLQSVSILFCNHEIGILKVKILEFDSLFLYIFYFFLKLYFCLVSVILKPFSGSLKNKYKIIKAIKTTMTEISSVSSFFCVKMSEKREKDRSFYF